MGKIIDETNNKYSRLLVLKYHGLSDRKSGGLAAWKCQCDCGNRVVVSGAKLRNGHTKSCGCLLREGNNHRVHGMSKTKFHNIWIGIKRRQYRYKVDVCERWMDFSNFKDDMYEYFLRHENQFGGLETSIDRIDNAKGYSPENCRWATVLQQQSNKGNNIHVMLDGQKVSLRHACTLLGLKYGTVWARVRVYGMTPEEALRA